MSKQLTEPQIKRRKKIQAYTSIAGGTLGLSALGARGVSVATAGGRTGKLLRIAARPGLSEKSKNWSTGLTTMGAGLGGASAFNFASYTKAEATKGKKRPVHKSYDGGMMDFGLGQVRQGKRIEEVSKAYVPRHVAPKVPKPAGAKLNQRFHGAIKQPVNARGMQGSMKGTLKTGIKTPFNNPSQKFTPVTAMGQKPKQQVLQKGSLTPLGKGTALGGVGLLGYGAGNKKRQPFSKALTPIGTARKTMPTTAQGTPNLGAARSPNAVAALSNAPGQAQRALVQQRKNTAMVAKAKDWQNISEHERRARDSRRTYKRGEAVAATGGWGVATSAGASALAGRDWSKEVHAAGKHVKGTVKLMSQPGYRAKGLEGGMYREMANYAIKRGFKGNPRGHAALAGMGLMAGGGATMIGARANEKRHDRAVARLRAERVKKAYDPERNRQRRLDRYANTTNIGAGALGAGAIYHGAGAVSLARKGRAAETGKWLNAAGKAKKANARAALGYYKSAAKAGGRSTAFAVGAGGAAVAADRIRRYKKGRGAKYSPLRLTEY